ncbi:hypothetical protein ACOI1H_10435 [Loktanella sp. DJP18]
MFATRLLFLSLLFGAMAACAPVPDLRGFSAEPYPSVPFVFSEIGL